MAIKDRFLREVRIGDYLDLVAGPKEIFGQVFSLDLDSVGIQKADGKRPTIALESISYFEISDAKTTKKDQTSSSPEKYNVFEKAVIDLDVDKIQKLLKDKDLLFSLGYNETTQKKMENCFTSNSFSKGESLYHIAARLELFQNNQNGTAEEFFQRASQDNTLSEELRLKAARRVYLYCIVEEKYEKYFDLLAKKPEVLDLSKGKELVFYLEASLAAGKDPEKVIRNVSCDFAAENDYNIVYKYLSTHPNNELAAKMTHQLTQKHKFPQASESALKYALANQSAKKFERLRMEFFVLLYPEIEPEQLENLLEIGHEVSWPTNTEDDVREIVGLCSEDETFGLIRAFMGLRRRGMLSDTIQTELKPFVENREAQWNTCIGENDRTRLLYFLYLYEICEVPQNMIDAKIRLLKKEEPAELVEALEEYDTDRLRTVLGNKKALLLQGYTNKNIDRFQRLLGNGSYPTGHTDYDIASRLYYWGFQNRAIKYYQKIADNPQMAKWKVSIRLLLDYAVQKEDTALFQKYYELLDESQKNNKIYVQFTNEILYREGEFQKLYETYLSDPGTELLSVLQGALRYTDNQETRSALIEKICASDSFDYDFWNTYLTERYAAAPEMYWEILGILLDEYPSKVLQSPADAVALAAIDRNFTDDVSEKSIKLAMGKGYPALLPLLLCSQMKKVDDRLKDKLFQRVLVQLDGLIENMDYKKACEIGSFALKIYTENDRLKELTRIASYGTDIYDMLPAEHDNYAAGKRFLLLGGNPERAFQCFENEIETSADKKSIALCGIELLKGFYKEKRYGEVIEWGKKLLLQKDITEYTSLALDMNNAFEQLGDSEGKSAFLNTLAERTYETLQNNQYKKAAEQIKLIEIFQKDHPFVLKYGALSDKVKEEKLSLNEDSFIGQANVIRYIEGDEEHYIAFLKDGFIKGMIKENDKTSAASMLLEAAIAENRIPENMDFIDNIPTYGIALSEHLVDLLYTAVRADGNMKYAIEFFTRLLNGTEESKKIPILNRLEKIYETALLGDIDFDARLAADQMQIFARQNTSLQARLCYIWLLAYMGNKAKAGEMLALISKNLNWTVEQQEILGRIIEKYFDGQWPALKSIFETLVKDSTLLRFVQHAREYKDAIFYSAEEEKIHAELMKDASFTIDPDNENLVSAIIKTIYEIPTKYRSWYLYYLCVKKDGKPDLIYCLDTNISILNLDVTSSIAEKEAELLLKNNPGVASRYKPYIIYNQLYKLYLMKAYQKNPVVTELINNLAVVKRIFSSNAEMRRQMGEDYIHLLKLLDDRDNDIYIQAAKFIAANNNCEEYFYSLFKNDLLQREHLLCLKMCIEMKASSGENQARLEEILKDLRDAHPEYSAVINILSGTGENIPILCSLLKDYPDIPEEGYIYDLLKKYEKQAPLSFFIGILETMDPCYPTAISVKKLLLSFYRKAQDPVYFEKMYQCALSILQATVYEEMLYGLCCMAVLLASVLGKTGRFADIVDIYTKQSLDRLHEKQLDLFCRCCERIVLPGSKNKSALLQAIITDDWERMFQDCGIGFLKELPDIKNLMEFSKGPFVQNALFHLASLEEHGERTESRKFADDLGGAVYALFAKSLRLEIEQFLGLKPNIQKLFAAAINLSQSSNPISDLPAEDLLIENLLRFWDVIYGREDVVRAIISYKTASKAYLMVNEKTIHFYRSEELLTEFVKYLFGRRDYPKILELNDSFAWAKEAEPYSTYVLAARLLKEGNGKIMDDAVKAMLQERYRNSAADQPAASPEETFTPTVPVPKADTQPEEKPGGEQTFTGSDYVLEARKEISLDEYADGIPANERERIMDVYEDLGNDIRENVEYRKELLTKLIFLSSEQNNPAAYHDYVEKLGIVLFYSYAPIDPKKSRQILLEAISYTGKETKRRTLELIREAACTMIGTYESIEEISAEKENLVITLNHLLSLNKAGVFNTFYTEILQTAEKIAETNAIKDLSLRENNYQKISGMLRTKLIRTSDNRLFGQTYAKWYRLIHDEVEKLSQGVMVSLVTETTQCSARGKICCLLLNMGKKPAENIIIKAIFEDGIRCRDSEKKIKILYGGDSDVFAFNIRSREDGIQKYKIELSYEIGSNVESTEYDEEIRIVRESGYEHIGNLYSVAPVTSNAEFYGREREKEEILTFLNDTKYNTSMVMHGLKRVGKTSMLRYIERTLRSSEIYIPIYKSAQSIGEKNAIGSMFVKSIIDELDNLGKTDDKCRSFLEFNYDRNPEQLYDFYQYLQNSGILGGKRILFMADEIEEIFDLVDRGTISDRFYKVLRVTLQELTSIRFIFCGADHLTDILYNHALADIFEITKRVVISRLDEEAMQRMIVEPAEDKLSYTEYAIERIWYYTKGHTFYSKHICSKIIDILNEESRVTAYAYDVDTAVKQIMRVTEYFIYLSRFFNDNDRQVIRLICENTRYAREKVSFDVLEDQYEGNGLMDSLTALEFKDILEKTESDDTDFYRFAIEMFRLWYSKTEYVTEAAKEQ